MPVRDIPKKYGNVSGRVAAEKRIISYQFESTLERDALFLYDMDENVELIEEQPLVIPYTINGSNRTYTPDLLVIYHDETNLPTKLIEVKYKDELEAKREQLEEKFNAAKRYCRERGWEFCVLTEKEIRTVKLDNLKFLKNYKYQTFKMDSYEIVEKALNGGKKSIKELLSILKMDKRDKACLLADIWLMVLNRHLECDLDKKLNILTEISINDD